MNYLLYSQCNCNRSTMTYSVSSDRMLLTSLLLCNAADVVNICNKNGRRLAILENYTSILALSYFFTLILHFYVFLRGKTFNATV